MVGAIGAALLGSGLERRPVTEPWRLWFNGGLFISCRTNCRGGSPGPA